MKKNLMVYLLLTMAIIFAFQNCGSFQSIVGASASPSQNLKLCTEVFTEFAAGFHQTFRSANCQECHDNGKMASFLPFAQSDSQQAFDAFNRYPVSQYLNNVSVGHKQDVLGYDKSALTTSLEANQDSLNSVLNECEDSGLSLLLGEKVIDLFDSTRLQNTNCGYNDPIKNAVVSTPFSLNSPDISTLSWDLGEIDSQWQGITIKLDITLANMTKPSSDYACPSQDGYLVGNLRVSSQHKKVRLENIKVLIDGDDRNNNHFWGLSNTFDVGASEERFLGAGTAFTNYTMTNAAVEATNQWSLFIESIEILQQSESN